MSALVARRGLAQDISGVVKDAATGMPLAGSVVFALDARRDTIARVLTSRAGAFRVAASGAASLRVIRIGYVPYEQGIGAARDAPITIAMAPLSPTRLRPVAVQSSALCPRRADQREALATWTAATDAFAAMLSGGSSDSQTGTVTQIVFDRVLDLAGRRIARQTAHRIVTANVTPIRAVRDASDFARAGFVERHPTSTVYWAPDPEVLVAPAFAASHCLSIRRDTGRHPDEIGLAFTPVRGRDSIPDITGVLWLRRMPLALRSLEFEYRGVDQAIRDAHAGGTIEFAALANGVPIIASWRIRSPRLRYVPTGDVADRRVQVTGAMAVVGELHESGGLIAAGTLADGTSWAYPLATLRGIVRNSRDSAAVAGAVVSIDSTDRSARTDALGRFRFTAVLPGPWNVRVEDSTAIHQVRVGTDGMLVADSILQQVVRRVARVKVTAASDRDAMAEVWLPWHAPVEGCRDGEEHEQSYIVFGDVVTPDSMPVRSANVTLDWVDDANPALQTIVEVHGNGLGGFVVCGMPGDRAIAASVTTSDGRSYLGSFTVQAQASDEFGRPLTTAIRRVRLVVVQKTPRSAR